jgi:manganese/zinc/iron transport system permease protein
MNLSPDDLWVMATAALCAASCAIPGVFLVVKREALVADALSHAILPGIVLGYIISGSREPLIMLIGAGIAGLAAMTMTTLLQRLRIARHDAGLGIVFTSFFAVGVLLLSAVARNVDLDPGCVLYGLIEFIPFHTWTVGGIDVPRACIILLGIFSLNVVLVTLFAKELTIAFFDPFLAHTLGFNPRALSYGLMATVTITAVGSFEAVGSIVVVSMFITPAATAALLTQRLSKMIYLAVCMGILSAIAGYLGALSYNTTVAGMMSIVAAILFGGAMLLSPQQGILSTLIRRTTLRFRIASDDIRGMLFRWHEVVTIEHPKPLRDRDIITALRSPLLARVALRILYNNGDIIRSADGSLRLTERGKVEAAALVRSHRLWETYLAKHLGLPLDHLHAASERTEHFIGRALARDIARDVESSTDPHGKEIP